MIDETISGSTPSSETNPTAANSDVIIEGGQPGGVFLQVKSPNGEWTNVTNRTGSYVVATPDANLSYRFKGINLEKSVRVYFT